MKVVKGLVILVFCFLAAFAFSTAAGNFLQPLAESKGGDTVTHHSHPTTMSLQGKVEGVSSGDIGVKVSDQNSCSSSVFFDHNYTGAIQDSLFNLLLGSQFDLNLNYNQDYYLCLYVEGELIDGPQQFRGGQGQIDIEDVNSAGFATEFVPYIGADYDLDMGAFDITTTAGGAFSTVTTDLLTVVDDIVADGTTASFGSVSVGSYVTSDLIPGTDDAYDIGTALRTWHDLFIADEGAIRNTTQAISVEDMVDAHDHISATGASHTYIDQNVTTTGTPTFAEVITPAISPVGNIIINTPGTGYLKRSGANIFAWTNSDVFVYKHLRLRYDAYRLYFGTGYDAYFKYDGANLLVNPRNAGSGNLIVTAGNLAVGTTAMQDKLTVDGNISATKDGNVLGDFYIGGTLYGGSPQLFGSADNPDKVFAIDFDEEVQTWCHKVEGVWSCDTPNQNILAKLESREQFKAHNMEREACLSQGIGWEMGEKGCRLNQEKECLAKEEYNYWDGSCQTNPYLDCIYNQFAKEWNYETQKCEADPVKECEAQQDKAWQDGECVLSQEKQNQRLAAECLADKSKYWTGNECIEASSLG